MQTTTTPGFTKPELTGPRLLSEMLGESEYRYRQIIQSLPAAVYTCDVQGCIMLYNKAAAVLWGREPEIGKDLWCGSWKIYRPDGSPLPIDECPMAVTLKEGRAVCGEEIIIERPDGVRRHVLPHPKPIFDASGAIVGAINMLVDVTEHNLTRHALQESEERFRTMADQAPIMIWMSDEKSNAVYLNRKWCEFTGSSCENGYGTGWADFIHPEDKMHAYGEWQQAFENRQPYDSKFRYMSAKGDYCIIKANYSPRINEQGEFMGYIGILNDVTLQESAKNLLEKLVEERTKDLVRSNAELERSNMELEQFAYAASHDLQEPLRKIRIFTNMLHERTQEVLNDEAKLYLEKIARSAGRMTRLINDLLNFSRLSNEEPFVQVDLNRIVENTTGDFDLLIRQKNAVIVNNGLPVIEGVELQMDQLFYNLISNSLKFVAQGVQPFITISCRQLPVDEVRQHTGLNENVIHYEILVTDNGIGFDQQYAGKVFVIFQRLHGMQEFSGSGIGLALCKKIVNNHQGDIFVESKEGEGSVFHIILPLRHS